MLNVPGHSGGNEGELVEIEHVGPVVQLLQEAVGHLGPLVDEVLLQGGGQRRRTHGPQQPVRAKERVIAKKAVQRCILGHHGGGGGQLLT